MPSHFKSKHGVIGRSNMELFMVFTDLRNLTSMIPANEKALEKVSFDADFDNLRISANGININVRITERVPYSKIVVDSVESPIKFTVTLNFHDMGGHRTEFFIELDAELNFLMKQMLGKKIENGLDMIIDTLEKQSAQI